jgi:hypothetical protein
MHVRFPSLALSVLIVVVAASCSAPGSEATATAAPPTLVPTATAAPPTLVPTAAPASSTPAASVFRLLVMNIDGPDTTITINGNRVLTVTCSLKNAAASVGELASTTAPLPWQVEAITTKGITLGKWTENGDKGPRQIVIRASGPMEEEAYGNAGTAPERSCAP